MKSFVFAVVLAVASVSAFADAGDRPDQVFGSTSASATPASKPAVVPATPASDVNTSLPPCFVNVYCGGA